MHAGHDVGAGLYPVDPVAEFLEAAARADGHGPEHGRHVVFETRLRPVGVLGFRHQVPRLGEAAAALEAVDHAPQVVGVGMREDDMRDLVRRDAGGLQVIGQLAQGRHEIGAAAGVDEDQRVGRADDGDVDLAQHHVGGQTTRCQQGIDLGRIAAGQREGERQRHRAVADDGDLEAADLEGRARARAAALAGQRGSGPAGEWERAGQQRQPPQGQSSQKRAPGRPAPVSIGLLSVLHCRLAPPPGRRWRARARRGWAARPGPGGQPKMSAVMPAYQPMFSACVCLRSASASAVWEMNASTEVILPSLFS